LLVPIGRVGTDPLPKDTKYLAVVLRTQMFNPKSDYSRRSLQLAFRAHLGCRPMQWVKRCLHEPNPALRATAANPIDAC
jgi:hypothetical protein